MFAFLAAHLVTALASPASAAEASVTVAVPERGCTTSFMSGGSYSPTVPGTTRLTVPSSDARVMVHLGLYASGAVGSNDRIRVGDTVLAPTGWSCVGTRGSDVGGVTVTASGNKGSQVSFIDIGLGTLPWTLCTWPHFAKAFCPLSPTKQHPVAYPGEIVRVLGPWVLAFEDPSGVHGHGDDSGGWNPDDGVIVLQPNPRDPHNLFYGLAYEANCTLPAAEHAWCTAVLDDALKEAGLHA